MKGNITLFGLTSVLMNDLKNPKSIQELKMKYHSIADGFLFERSISLLVNLSLIVRSQDGMIRAKRGHVNPRQVYVAAMS